MKKFISIKSRNQRFMLVLAPHCSVYALGLFGYAITKTNKDIFFVDTFKGKQTKLF